MASYADEDGNISLEEEPANLDIYAMAAAAHNSGGKVIFQVKGKVPRNSLKAREVRIPGALVDAVVIDPCQRQGYDLVYDAALSGEAYRDNIQEQPLSFSPRLVDRSAGAKGTYCGVGDQFLALAYLIRWPS